MDDGRRKILPRECKNLPAFKKRTDTFIVEELLDKKVRRSGRTSYLVKWWGFTAEDSTWELRDHLIQDCPAMVLRYEQEQGMTAASDEYRSLLHATGAHMGRQKNLEQQAYNYKAEKILDRKEKNGFVKYFVKWEGYNSDFNSWECEKNIMQDQEELVKEFEAERNGHQATIEVNSKNCSTSSPTNYNVENEQQPCCSQQSIQPLESSVKHPDVFIGNHKVESVVGVTKQEDEFYFLIKCSGLDEVQYVSCTQGNQLFPHLVDQFLKEKPTFDNPLQASEAVEGIGDVVMLED